MKKIAKQSVIILMITTLISIPFGSSILAQDYFEAREPSGEAMIYDAVVVRPIGLVATVVGMAFLVVTLPFSALGDNVGIAGQKLVEDPGKYTFKRPLGEF